MRAHPAQDHPLCVANAQPQPSDGCALCQELALLDGLLGHAGFVHTV